MVFIPADLSNFRFRRSALFMPASNSRALEKAPSLDCDCVIIDLEDAIAGEAITTAHANLRSHVKGQNFGSSERVIRIGSDTDMPIALECQPDAILLPKVSGANDILKMDQYLSDAHSNIQLWAMIETPAGLMNLQEIISACDRLKCLVVGPNDLAKATGVKPTKGRPDLHSWLMMIIAAARSRGLSVLDGVYNNFKDGEGFMAECEQAANMGFDGKTLIHPTQIADANLAFGPQATEIEQAEKIIAAFSLEENKAKGVIQLDGEMLERLHLEQALTLLKLIEEI